MVSAPNMARFKYLISSPQLSCNGGVFNPQAAGEENEAERLINMPKNKNTQFINGKLALISGSGLSNSKFMLLTTPHRTVNF